jgi:hypothetical protein
MNKETQNKFLITKGGLPFGHDKIESIEDSRQLANNNVVGYNVGIEH